MKLEIIGTVQAVTAETARGTEDADIDTEHLRIGISRKLKTRRHKADSAFDVLTTYPPDEEFSVPRHQKKHRGGK